MSGFTNKPKILRGAFVEFGLTIPPLFVVFQFNPEQLSRSRSLSFNVPGQPFVCPPCPPAEGERAVPQPRIFERSTSLRQRHNEIADPLEIQEKQLVEVKEESINFEIRLDATDDLNDGDPIVELFGILPRLSTLELMVHPKEESLLGSPGGISLTKKPNPPLILFIWGLWRVLPVNISSINITEQQFNTMLNPLRATVSVNMTVIEGANPFYKYSKAAKELTSALNRANVADVVIPG